MYEHFTRQNKTKAFHYMKLCEDVLLEPDNQSDPFYKSIEKSLWHVFLATKLGLISQGNAADKDLIQSVSQNHVIIIYIIFNPLFLYYYNSNKKV
jgi:hypothetical protein